MEDLSSRLPADPLSVTGQGADGIVGRGGAMSAPGTMPSALAAGFTRIPKPQSDPHIETIEADGRHLVHGGGEAS